MIGEVRWGEDTNTVLAMIFSQLNTILCWWRSWPVRLSVFAYSLSSHSFTSIETSWMWKNTLREGGREDEEESEVQILPQHQPSPASRHTQWKLRICRQLCLCYQFESLSKFRTITLFSSQIKIQPWRGKIIWWVSSSLTIRLAAATTFSFDLNKRFFV